MFIRTVSLVADPCQLPSNPALERRQQKAEASYPFLFALGEKISAFSRVISTWRPGAAIGPSFVCGFFLFKRINRPKIG